MAEDNAVRLIPGRLPYTGPVMFGQVFPGEHREGEPVALELLGLDLKEAQRLIKEHDLPLETVRMAAKKAEAQVEAHTPPPAETVTGPEGVQSRG